MTQPAKKQEEDLRSQLSEKQLKAMKLLQSQRGQYIVSEALCLAIEAIEAREPIHQCPSDVADMRVLLHMFPLYRSLAAVEKDTRDAYDAKQRSRKKLDELDELDELTKLTEETDGYKELD